jgi:hypothetical protein
MMSAAAGRKKNYADMDFVSGVSALKFVVFYVTSSTHAPTDFFAAVSDVFNEAICILTNQNTQ